MSGRTSLIYSMVIAGMGMAGISLGPESLATEPGDGQERPPGEIDRLDMKSEARMEAALGLEPTMCPPPGDLGPGDHTIAIVHDGMDRTYRLHVPASYDSALPAPMVVNLHGSWPAPDQMASFSGMDRVADENGFVVAYPEGFLGSWNAGSCCGAAGIMGVNDVGFLVSVVEDVSTRLCVDTDRVYAAGFHTGGSMAHRLACDASHVFAAVGIVGARNFDSTCSPPRGVSVIGFHGTQDDLVDYEHGELGLMSWIFNDGCAGEPTRAIHGASYCETHVSCNDGAQVSFCTMDRMASCWPGGDPRMCDRMSETWSGDIDASTHMWEFFSGFLMP